MGKYFRSNLTRERSKLFDRWFIGGTPEYVGGVWYGYDTPKEVIALQKNIVEKESEILSLKSEIKTLKSAIRSYRKICDSISNSLGKVPTIND